MLDWNIPPRHIKGMTNLKSYLKKKCIRQADFAERLGISQGTVSKIASGDALPGLALAVQIENITKGAVKAVSFARDATQEAAP